LIARKTNQEDTAILHELIHFTLGDKECYGIDYFYIDEILRDWPITPVPHASNEILGVINRRSDILPVINLGSFFNIDIESSNKSNWIIIIKHLSTTLGIKASQILGNIFFDPDNLIPPIENNGIAHIKYIQGIHNSQITVIDISTMMKDLISNGGDKRDEK